MSRLYDTWEAVNILTGRDEDKEYIFSWAAEDEEDITEAINIIGFYFGRVIFDEYGDKYHWLPERLDHDQIMDCIKTFDAGTDNEFIWRGDHYEYDYSELQDWTGLDGNQGQTIKNG